VRDEQTHPHRPRLVVSHSTCPPLSSSPHANSFVIGPAVIKHTQRANANDAFDPALWETFVSTTLGLEVPILAALPRLNNSPLAKCGCKKFCMDFHGDHTSTCTSHSGATKAHDWMVSVIGTLFRTAGHLVRTQHGVTASAGQLRGDVEVRSFLRDQAGSRSLVFDLSITHDRFGSSTHVQQNGSLSHPQDLDGPMRVAAQLRNTEGRGTRVRLRIHLRFMSRGLSRTDSMCARHTDSSCAPQPPTGPPTLRSLSKSLWRSSFVTSAAFVVDSGSIRLTGNTAIGSGSCDLSRSRSADALSIDPMSACVNICDLSRA
jgi:hypothetical protein